MKIALSTQERAVIAVIMTKGTWGGDTALLLAQASLYDALDLAVFGTMTPAAIGRSSPIDRTSYELAADAGAVLVSVLSSGGQPVALALVSAGILRRIDPLAAAAAADPPAPAPPPPTNHKRRSKGLRP